MSKGVKELIWKIHMNSVKFLEKYYADSNTTIGDFFPIKINWNFFIIVVILYQIDSNKQHGGS